MESQITATEMARSLSDVLNRVVYRGEAFLVKRGGEPICRIVPAGPRKCTLGALLEFLDQGPKPDSGFWDDLEKITTEQPLMPEGRW